MRVSEGVFFGRIAKLNNLEKFQNREEVIGFPLEDFNRTYNSISQQIDYINKIGLHLDESEEWKLIGYWPKIMQRVHRIDMHMAFNTQKRTTYNHILMHTYMRIFKVPRRGLQYLNRKPSLKLKFRI